MGDSLCRTFVEISINRNSLDFFFKIRSLVAKQFAHVLIFYNYLSVSLFFFLDTLKVLAIINRYGKCRVKKFRNVFCNFDITL